jgi:hypothetical protein
MNYEFSRLHKTLAIPYPETPAMTAETESSILKTEELIYLAD